MQNSKVCSAYAVQPDSTLQFEGKSSLHAVRGMATDLTGSFTAAWNDDGTLAQDPAPSMHVEFSVDKLRTGNALEDREMAKVIDSKRFPKVAGDLRTITTTSTPGRYAALGQITLAGRARQYDGEIALTHDGGWVKVQGTLTIDVRDFGIAPPSFLMLKVDPTITVRLDLVAANGT